MNSKQIIACVGAGFLMVGLLWLVARRNVTPVDPNDAMVSVARTVTLNGDTPDNGAVDSAPLVRKAGRDATNLFRIRPEDIITITNEHFQGPKAAEGGLLQSEALGLLPGGLPKR